MSDRNAKFVAMGPHCWGRGDTPAEAVKQCKQAGFRGRAVGVLRIFEAPSGASKPYVNEIGDVCWTWDGTAEGTRGRWGMWKGKHGVAWETNGGV